MMSLWPYALLGFKKEVEFLSRHCLCALMEFHSILPRSLVRQVGIFFHFTPNPHFAQAVMVQK